MRKSMGSALIVKHRGVFITLETAFQRLQLKAAVEGVFHFAEVEHKPHCNTRLRTKFECRPKILTNSALHINLI